MRRGAKASGTLRCEEMGALSRAVRVIGVGVGLVLAAACASPSSEAPAPPPSEGGAPTADAGLDARGDAPGPVLDAEPDAPSEPPPSAECVSYCDLMDRACTGDARAFPSRGACLRACALYPVGNPGEVTGNSRTCRIAHAEAAESTPEHARGHCLHAGLFGYSGCGEPCEALCTVGRSWCGGAGLALFASEQSCLTACAAFQPALPELGPGIPQYGVAGPTTGDTIDCREHHLVQALESLAARDQRCPNLAEASPACR